MTPTMSAMLCLVALPLLGAAIIEISYRYRLHQRMQARVEALMRP